MSDQEIIEELGLTRADELTKNQTIDQVYNVVERRVRNVLADILTDEEVQYIEQMERDGKSKDEIFWWLGENVASAHEMLDAMLRDYVQELKSKLDNLI